LKFNTVEYKYKCIVGFFSNHVRVIDEKKVISFVNVYFDTNLLTFKWIVTSA